MDPPDSALAPTARRVARVALLAVLALAVGAMLVAQLDAQDQSLGLTRSCGSVFDTAVDRAGWEAWWIADLGEPDPAVRAKLVRTSDCPGVVNARIAQSVVLVAVTSVVGFGVWYSGAAARRSRRVARPRYGRLERLGTLGLVAGAFLVVAGITGLMLLVANRDSTLFLYLDRRVVAVIGLIVLLPPIALALVGRGLSVLARLLADAAASSSDKDDG